MLYTLGRTCVSSHEILGESMHQSLYKWSAAACAVMGLGATVAIWSAVYEYNQCTVDGKYADRHDDHIGLCTVGIPAMAFGALQCAVVLIWYLSLLTAAALASTKVASVHSEITNRFMAGRTPREVGLAERQVQMEAATTGPADIDMTLWDDKVRTPAVRLARETLPALSEWGFGTSALFFGGFFLVLGLVPGGSCRLFYLYRSAHARQSLRAPC